MIQHNFFSPLYNILSTDNKYSKLLEWIMIKYLHKYNYHIFLYNTISKMDVLNECDV